MWKLFLDNVVCLLVVDCVVFFGEIVVGCGVVNMIIEKDFWVCWILWWVFLLLFGKIVLLVFKGGILLFKVYDVICWFFEDIDLFFDWVELGYGGEWDFE